MAVPAAFGDGSATVWMDNKSHFVVFVAMIHPKRGELMPLVYLVSGENQ